MLPKPVNYTIWPCVIPAETTSEMIITAAERAFFLWEGEEYSLRIVAVGGDDDDYYTLPLKSSVALQATAHDGVLRFSFPFGAEGEYQITLSRGEQELQKFFVYALGEDLYRLRALKGDLHSHSYRSDGKRDPAAVAGYYRELGYDFEALTDHNRYFPGDELEDAYAGLKMGYTRVLGEEVHAPGSIVHIVHVGGKSSVADLYVHDRPGYEREIAEYEEKVPADIPERYRARYARSMWSTDKIHAAGGLAIFPHPYWIPKAVYNVCDEFAAILLKSGMFDAFELVGAGGNAAKNRSVALWTSLLAEGVKFPVVGSSDSHDAGMLRQFTVCFAEENENDAIMDAVKAGRCVAVECDPEPVHDEYIYRCYGDLRLVSYAQFLLKEYFPRRQRICQSEGVTMRQYVMGEADGALVEALARQSADFSNRFFGRKAPALPTPAMLAFEEKWRGVRLNGTVTKGSKAYSEKANRQI